ELQGRSLTESSKYDRESGNGRVRRDYAAVGGVWGRVSFGKGLAAVIGNRSSDLLENKEPRQFPAIFQVQREIPTRSRKSPRLLSPLSPRAQRPCGGGISNQKSNETQREHGVIERGAEVLPEGSLRAGIV